MEMIGAFFAGFVTFGALQFWFLSLVFLLAGLGSAKVERFGLTTFFVLGYIVLIWGFGQGIPVVDSFLSWAFADWLNSLITILSYIGLGFIWVTFKYFMDVSKNRRRIKNDLEGHREVFYDENRISLASSEPVPQKYQAQWQEFKLKQVKPKDDTGDIAIRWMLWPLSLVANLVGDYILNFFDYLVNLLKGFFHKIQELAVRGID